MYANQCCLRIFTTFFFCWKHILTDTSRCIFYKISDYSVWYPESFKVFAFFFFNLHLFQGKSLWSSYLCRESVNEVQIWTSENFFFNYRNIITSDSFLGVHKGDRNHWQGCRSVKYCMWSVRVHDLKAPSIKTIGITSFCNKSAMK